MPTNKTEIKPLTPNEIKAGLMLAGFKPADVARRVEERTQRPCPNANVSRVIHRTPGFSFPEIRREIASILKQPIAAIGREASRATRKKGVRKSRTVAPAPGA